MNIKSIRLSSLALILGATACSSSPTATGNDADAMSDADTSDTTSDATISDVVSDTNVTDSVVNADSATDGDVAPTAASACAAQAHATCTERDTCSLTSYDNDVNYGSEAVCESRLTTTCINGLAATGTAQTPTHIESCVAVYGSYSCTDFRDNNPPAACVPPAGSLANGAACGASAQCASTYCAISQYQVCGLCATLPVVGAACQVTTDCGRDLACAIPTGSTTGTCAAYVASGGTCLTGVNPCEAGLSCVGDNATATPAVSGTCQASGATVGATCDRSRKTMATCDGNLGLTCIPSAAGSSLGTCQAIAMVGPNATCGVIGTNPVASEAACLAGGLCKKAAGTDAAADPTGTCMAPASDGQACNTDPTIGPPCLDPAKCVPGADGGTAGTCTLSNAANCH